MKEGTLSNSPCLGGEQKLPPYGEGGGRPPLLLEGLGKAVGAAFLPIRQNLVFFVCMFVLGYLCTQLEVTLHLAGAKPYELSAIELFVDLYIVCLLLMLIPKKVRRWVSLALGVVLCLIALVDMFCYVRFESTLTPTMLMLAQETDGRETSEFFRSYVGWNLLTTKVGWVVLITIVFIVWGKWGKWDSWDSWDSWGKWGPTPTLPKGGRRGGRLLGLLIIPLLVYGIVVTWQNKQAMTRLFSYDTIGQVEHDLTRRDAANLYLPVYRLAFSIYANHLAGKQIKQLAIAREHIYIDSCGFRTPTIVLIIGESYNKYHSQLYGYDKATSPRQLQWSQDSSLVVFDDVVACWNLTSFAFKHFLSLHAIGDKGDWCDAPLFPEVFRKAGYRVTFLTNQFMSKASEKVYDFSGGVFLNNPEVSAQLFDERNDRLFRYDEGLLSLSFPLPKEGRDGSAKSPLLPEGVGARLLIYHLMGQHVDYVARFPKERRKFTTADYDRPDLNREQLTCLANYDNATAYNDSVVDAIIKRYEQEDAVVIYMPDHGEECFNPPMKFHGRLHSARIDRRLAREEFEIPFWIWCSPMNRERHPETYAAMKAARHRPFMTDNLPHLLLGLAGISTKDYRADYDLLSPDYNSQRPRMLKNQTDYNQLKNERMKK